MRIGSVKAIFGKATAVAVLAGAVLLAAPTRASAQAFAIGVQFGHPAFGYNYGPGPVYDARWQRDRYAAERRDAWIRHDDWRYHHDFNRYPPRAVPYGYVR